MPELTELIALAPWREAVTYRDTWPHEYVLTEKDNQRDLLDAVCSRFRAGEGVSCRFFRMANTYLFIGGYKYWLMTDYNDIDAYNDEGDYVINRSRLYRDRRDFIIQPEDTGKSEDYPHNPAYDPKMRVATVEKAIQEVKRRISEWKEVGLPSWREDQTRYGIIDPIIRALGWDTAEPKECHPEYPRSDDGNHRVDYAFFTRLDMTKLREDDMPAPDIIVEAKALGDALDEHVEKLREYVQARPRMSRGVAILTNGVEWRFYPVGTRGGLPRKLDEGDVINIQELQPKRAAQTLNRQLGRPPFR